MGLGALSLDFQNQVLGWHISTNDKGDLQGSGWSLSILIDELHRMITHRALGTATMESVIVTL